MEKFTVGDFVLHQVEEEIGGKSIRDGLGAGEVINVLAKDIYEVLFPVEDSIEKADMVVKVNGQSLRLLSKPTLRESGPMMQRAAEASRALDCWPVEAESDGSFPCEVYLGTEGKHPLILDRVYIRKCDNKIPNTEDSFVAHADITLNGIITVHNFSLRKNSNGSYKLYAPKDNKYVLVRLTGEDKEITYRKIVKAIVTAYEL